MQSTDTNNVGFTEIVRKVGIRSSLTYCKSLNSEVKKGYNLLIPNKLVEKTHSSATSRRIRIETPTDYQHRPDQPEIQVQHPEE